MFKLARRSYFDDFFDNFLKQTLQEIVRF